MHKVFIYSLLLLLGLVASQFMPALGSGLFATVDEVVRLLTVACLAFIMIHVGYEFEIDKSSLRTYGWDNVVAAIAAASPWLLCAMYFVFVMSPPEARGSALRWKESLLTACFAAPTSAGILFSMLAAAGLSATWVFQKARILAIFDDLDTLLLLIPLKMMMVGLRWQLGIIVLIMGVLLWGAWRYLHALRIPVTWPWVVGYAASLTFACELFFHASKVIDETFPVHLEGLLPAFVLGCVMARPPGSNPHRDDARVGHEEGPESPSEQKASTVISACFMVLVGLSMPALATIALPATGEGMTTAVGSSDIGRMAEPWPGWGMITVHVMLVTLLSNLGKLFPMLCYRREASIRERMALAIGMFPRGEVGAGILVVSLSYGLGGSILTVAMLSLALNLICTGLFIAVVRKLLVTERRSPAMAA